MQKTKIEDHMLLSQQDRQAHIDLSTDCEFYYYTKQYNYNGTIKQIGDLYGHRKQIEEVKRRLLDFHNIEAFGGNSIHACHKCQNCSTSDKVCVNSKHCYFGTVSENYNDIPKEIRKEICSKGGQTTVKNETGWFAMTEQQKYEATIKGGQTGGLDPDNGFNKKDKCKYCSKEMNIANIKQHHNENCKSKP